MGSTVSSNNNISRVEVSKSETEQDQCVQYSTPDSRTCTFRVHAGVDSACVSLRDYTFDREGTRVDIRVRDTETNNRGSGGGDVGRVDVKYGGSALQVRKDAGQFGIVYGVPHVRCGFLVATKHDTDSHGSTLFVTHMYGTVEQRMLSLAVMQVWYDRSKGSFVCDLTGPSRHTSTVDVMLAMRKAYAGVSDASFPTGQQTTVTGLINNTGGPVYGDMNGSMINFFNFFLNYK